MVDDGVVGKCITVIQSGEPNVSQIAPGNLVVSNFRFYPGRRLTTIVLNKLSLESAVYNQLLVANDFDVPELLETERLRLRPLTINDAVRDYDAVMTSEQRLRTVFELGGDWPEDSLWSRISLSWAGIRPNFSCVHRLPLPWSAWMNLKFWVVFTFILLKNLNSMLKSLYGYDNR